jgi:hypothetical protein
MDTQIKDKISETITSNMVLEIFVVLTHELKQYININFSLFLT